MRQIVDAAGRKQQTVRGHVEPASVRDRRHFDRGFGAVQKRVEHLRVHAGRLRFAGRQSVMTPDAVRRHVVIGRQIFGALAGGDHAKARRARPVHHLGGQRRLVAIGQRIDHTGLARFLGQQRTRQHVGLDIDHDDMLARRNRRAGMPDADGRIAGRLHHDVHRAAGNGAHAVIGESRSRDPLRIPADGAARLAGAVAIEVDDHGHLESRRVRHLRQEHRAEFSGADQCDANRLAGRKAGVEEAMKVHGKCPLRIRRVPDAVQRAHAAPQSRDPS